MGRLGRSSAVRHAPGSSGERASGRRSSWGDRDARPSDEAGPGRDVDAGDGLVVTVGAALAQNAAPKANRNANANAKAARGVPAQGQGQAGAQAPAPAAAPAPKAAAGDPLAVDAQAKAWAP